MAWKILTGAGVQRIYLHGPKPLSLKRYTEADRRPIGLGRSATIPEHCNELRESACGHLPSAKFQVNCRIAGCFAQSVTENEIIDHSKQREPLFTCRVLVLARACRHCSIWRIAFSPGWRR
jgi:hypothetical protein